MKISRFISVLLVPLAWSCAKPPVPGVAQDTAGLPHFKIVHVISDHLIQVGPNDEVITSHIATSRNSGYQAFATGNEIPYMPSASTEPKEDSFQIRIGDTVSKTSPDTFLDDTGKPHKYPKIDNIVETIDGEKVMLQPLRLPSLKYRYYTGTHGVYATSIQTGKAQKIFDRPISPFVAGRNDLLTASVQDDIAPCKVYQFGVDTQPKLIYQGSDCKVRDMDQDGSVIIEDASQFYVADSKGAVRLIPNASFDVNFFRYKGKTWFVGFRLVLSSDKKAKNSHPAIWNDKGETVALAKLCPDLNNRITKLKSMHYARILSNSNGLIAFEMFGSNPNPDYNYGGMNPGNTSDRIYSTLVYIIRADGIEPLKAQPQ